MLLFALGCAPAELTVGLPSSTETTVDSAVGPAADPDLTVWTGVRELSGDCEATLTEEGEALEAGWDYYDWLQAECPSCDLFYLVRVSPEEVCDLRVTQEVLRGLDLDDPDAVEVVGFDNQGVQRFDDQATLQGLTLSYEYTLEYEGTRIDVAGRVDFPPL